MKLTKRSGGSNKANHIPRPKNSFMVYRQEKQHEAAKFIDGNNNKDISKLVGKWWNNETEEVKDVYRKKAELAKKKHSEMYPDYRYCPKKSSKQIHPGLPVLASNVTRQHYQEYSNFPYPDLSSSYSQGEVLNNVPCTCCDTYPGFYNIEMPIQESFKQEYFYNNDIPAYEAPSQPFVSELNMNYLTPITQSPASVASATFAQSQDPLGSLWNENYVQLADYKSSCSFYNQCDVPIAEGSVDPTVFYPNFY